jgi:NAD-dependent SIR2 family protein deacetylase
LKKMAHVKIHMKIHEKNLKCVKCGKMFYYEKKLEDHVDNQYQCSMCQNRFCKAQEFKKHNRYTHIVHVHDVHIFNNRLVYKFLVSV